MAFKYVPITRYFREVQDDATVLTRRLVRSWTESPGLTWSSLLEDSSLSLRPIVLVAPSGTGKSTELEHQAFGLREAGRLAVFAEAPAILDDLRLGLGKEERPTFDAWLGSNAGMVLFVDAVDELHLAHKRLKDLLRCFERDVDLARPIQLIFSARNGAWPASSTLELTRCLARVWKSGTETSKSAEPRLVTFEPIDDDSIRQLAKANGVTDVDQFMRAFEDDELGNLMELRPMDLEPLIRRWKAHRDFGSWNRILGDFISTSFGEEPPERARISMLAPKDVRDGLLRAAAASALIKTPHLSQPGAAAVDGIISSRHLFSDWPQAHLLELVEHHFFSPKGKAGNAVQLPQGPISHLLAAQWFTERVRNGRSAQDIRDTLCVRVFDEEGFRIPELLRPVVGWVASQVPDFRKMILREFPEVVLFEGDPDSLAETEIRACLAYLTTKIAANPELDPWPTRATLRKLAREGLENDVRNLLLAGSACERIRYLALQLVRLGRYKSCVPQALQVARDSSLPGTFRGLAVSAISEVGNDSERATLESLYADQDGDVRAALIRALVPELLHGDSLVYLLSSGGGKEIGYVLEDVADRLSVADLDAILKILLKGLSRSEMSHATEQRINVALPLSAARLRKGGVIADYVVDVIATLEAIEGLPGGIYFPPRITSAIDLALKADDTTRRSLWMRKLGAVGQDPSAYQFVMDPLFGDANERDLEWLYNVGQTDSSALDVIRRVWSRLDPLACRAKEADDSIHSELRQYLAQLTSARREEEDADRARNERKRERAEKQRQANQEALAPKREAIESGDDAHALRWGWNHIRGHEPGSVPVEPTQLRALVGDEYTEVFLRGMRRFWRKQNVSLPTPDADRTFNELVALEGLTLDVRAGLEVSTLSTRDAALATCLAAHEANSFPFWFGELFEAHPETVTETLRSVLAAEWNWAKENHGVLRLGARGSSNVAGALRDIVLQLLEQGPPCHVQTIKYAVDVLLTSSTNALRVAELARREVARGQHDVARMSEWLRLWSHVESSSAADWIRDRREEDGVGFQPVLAKTIPLLEQDLDGRVGRPVASALMAPQALARWVRLLLPFTTNRAGTQGAGVMGPDDYAQLFRERCLVALAENATREAYAVLKALIVDPDMLAHRSVLLRLAERQCARAAEEASKKWTEGDVLGWEQGDEKPPRSLDELVTLVRAHLDDVGRLVMNDDFSYRALFTDITHEREIQLWVASSLQARARGLYSVVRENVVDVNKEVDISAFAPGVGSVPIEIKPLGPYSAGDLVDTIQTQLLGLYMQPRDRRFGVLLLVRRDRKAWIIDHRRADLVRLVEHLRGRARDIGLAHGKTISVSLIDLLRAPSDHAEVESVRGPKRRTAEKTFKAKPR